MTRRRVATVTLLPAIVLALGLVLVAASWASAQAPLSPELSAQVEAHRLRVENAQLRADLARLQAELDSQRLTAERAALEQRLREALKPPADHVFDWVRQQFIPPQEPPK